MVGSTVEAELLEIRQKVKALESSKAKAASRAEEAQKLIASQRAQIDKLKQENRQLQVEIDGKATASTSVSQQDRLDKLHELADTYTRKIEMEGRQLESIQQELELTQVKVHELRKGMGGTHAPDESQRQAAKHRLVLENRLEQAERRFCETLAKNKEMREQIESINKQRETFEQAQLKLERELAGKRSEVLTLRQTMTVANEARVLAQGQLESLRTQFDKEQAAFEAETAELQRCLSGDQQLLEVQAQRLERLLSTPDVQGGQVEEEEGGPTFEEAVSQLAEAAGLESKAFAQLFAHYSNLEATNFALFNECNVANEKIAAMQKRIRSLENEARQAEVEGVLGKQKEVIRQTLTKRDQALRRAEVLDEKRVAMERRLTAIRSGVSHVLKALGCAPAGPSGAPAGPDSVLSALQRQLQQTQQQATSLAQSLGQMEARARAIVAVWSVVMGKTSNVPGAKAMVQTPLSSARSKEVAMAAASAVAASSPGAAAAGKKSAAGGVAGKGQAEASPNKSYGNKLFDDSGSESEDEAPLTRDQIQERIASGR